jgi:hypothetical protein
MVRQWRQAWVSRVGWMRDRYLGRCPHRAAAEQLEMMLLALKEQSAAKEWDAQQTLEQIK